MPIVARVRGLRFRVAVHRRRAHEGVGTNRNRLPLRCSAAVINGFQRVALSERHISDARHAVRNDDARKPVAICKCTFAYAGYAASDGYACKTVAICKCTFAYARYAVRDDDARKTVAISKCKVAYAGYAASDGYARKPVAKSERLNANTFHTVSDGYACKPLAIRERIIPDARHAFRDSHTLQRGAAIKCTLSDLILFNQCAIIRLERRGKRESRLRTIISDKIALAAVVEEAIAV